METYDVVHRFVYVIRAELYVLNKQTRTKNDVNEHTNKNDGGNSSMTCLKLVANMQPQPLTSIPKP